MLDSDNIVSSKECKKTVIRKTFKLIDHISTVHDLLRAKFIKKVKSSIN